MLEASTHARRFSSISALVFFSPLTTWRSNSCEKESTSFPGSFAILFFRLPKTLGTRMKKSHVVSGGVILAGLFERYDHFSRLLFVLRCVGKGFMKVKEWSSIVSSFVCGEEATNLLTRVGSKRKLANVTEEESSVIVEAESLFHLLPSIGEEKFKEFHEYGVDCGVPLGALFVSDRELCCKRTLIIDSDASSVVVVYDDRKGTYLGSRVVKVCRRCKIYEHYDFWTKGGKRRKIVVSFCFIIRNVEVV